jgi:hypothetical protein
MERYREPNETMYNPAVAILAFFESTRKNKTVVSESSSRIVMMKQVNLVVVCHGPCVHEALLIHVLAAVFLTRYGQAGSLANAWNRGVDVDVLTQAVNKLRGCRCTTVHLDVEGKSYKRPTSIRLIFVY